VTTGETDDSISLIPPHHRAFPRSFPCFPPSLFLFPCHGPLPPPELRCERRALQTAMLPTVERADSLSLHRAPITSRPRAPVPRGLKLCFRPAQIKSMHPDLCSLDRFLFLLLQPHAKFRGASAPVQRAALLRPLVSCLLRFSRDLPSVFPLSSALGLSRPSCWPLV
jgi:hypothetical protein